MQYSLAGASSRAELAVSAGRHVSGPFFLARGRFHAPAVLGNRAWLGAMDQYPRQLLLRTCDRRDFRLLPLAAAAGLDVRSRGRMAARTLVRLRVPCVI